MKRRAILIVLDGVGIGAARCRTVRGRGQQLAGQYRCGLNGLQLPNLSGWDWGIWPTLKG